MKKDLISITLSFEDDFNKELLKCWSILKKRFKTKYISTRSEKPHISLLSGYVNDINKIIKILNKTKTKPFFFEYKRTGFVL